MLVEGSIVVFNVKMAKRLRLPAKLKFTKTYIKRYTVIDPTKVTRVALENAASIASMIISTECAIVEKTKWSSAMPPCGGGMGGMIYICNLLLNRFFIRHYFLSAFLLW